MLVKSYCGCSMFELRGKGVFVCMDNATKEICCVGSYEKCNEYLTERKCCNE